MDKVLLLNSSDEPLNLCSWRRAIALMVKGKAKEVERLDSFINKNYQYPTVIKLCYYVAVPVKELPFNKKNILTRDNYTCQYCGKKLNDLTLDHIFPKSRGGGYSWENIVACCKECNQKKADRTPVEAGMKLLRKPYRPKDYIKFEFEKYSPFKYKEIWNKYIAS